MMTTPDEIKKGLECCMDHDGTCEDGPYVDGECRAFEQLAGDALALIQQLQADNAEQAEKIHQLKAERDALMHWAKGRCDTCAYNDDCVKHAPDPEGYFMHWYDDCESWEWRGVQKEE